MHFPVTEGIVRRRTIGEVKAVDGVDFTIRRGETLGLVGESGCGKTTTGRCILRLEQPTAGEILYDGVDIAEARPHGAGRAAAADPGDLPGPLQLAQPAHEGRRRSSPSRCKVHGIEPDAERRAARVRELLSVCGLDPNFADRYPHEMSGGQRQRVGIARALALDPEFIVCDEAVSALDVSIQAQVINLLEDLRERFGLTYLFIAHDLVGGAASLPARRGDVSRPHRRARRLRRALRQPAAPLHPGAARGGAGARPDGRGRAARSGRCTGEVPSPINPPPGCVFHPRCPIAVETLQAGCARSCGRCGQAIGSPAARCTRASTGESREQRYGKRNEQEMKTNAGSGSAAGLGMRRRRRSPARPRADETPKRGGILTYMIPADAPPSFDGHRETTYRDGARGGAVLQRADPDQSRTTRPRPPISSAICAPRCRSRPMTARPTPSRSAQGVKFHDGSPLTAADVAASWQRDHPSARGRARARARAIS